MKKILFLFASALLFSCKKESITCYNIQVEKYTVYHENSPNFYRYGKDNTDTERTVYLECNLEKVDSLLQFANPQKIDGAEFCIVIKRNITKTKKD
jgi:hypothetical protein